MSHTKYGTTANQLVVQVRFYTNYINNIAVDLSSSDWSNKNEHDQWALYKTIKTYGINIQYFIAPELLFGAEFNTSFIVRKHYQKEDKAQRNNYMSLSIKFFF